MFGHFEGVSLVAVRFKRLKLFGPYDHAPETSVRVMVPLQALLIEKPLSPRWLTVLTATLTPLRVLIRIPKVVSPVGFGLGPELQLKVRRPEYWTTR
jgi:hypothetical protein